MHHTTVIPWKAVSSVTTLGILTPGWNLTEIEEGDPHAARTFTTKVEFLDAFQFPPVLHTSLVGFDLDQRDSQRLSIAASNITTTSFDLSVTTWMASRVYSVEVNWLALGS